MNSSLEDIQYEKKRKQALHVISIVLFVLSSFLSQDNVESNVWRSNSIDATSIYVSIMRYRAYFCP